MSTSQRRTVFAVLLQVAACAPTGQTPPVPPSGVASDVAYLASTELQGRAVGSSGGDRAAIFIASRYVELGVVGSFTCASSATCSPYVQAFPVNGLRGENVVATVPGSDPTLRGRYIVVGAHYDHLGYSLEGALDRELGEVLRPGADDNASGTAALLELAQRLARNPAGSPVILAHFDAEEIGLLGSRAFVETPPVPLDSIMLMINLDMIGRLRGGSVRVDVTDGAIGYREMIDSLASALGLPTQRYRLTGGRSDHMSFEDVGIPAVMLFTGFHNDYHRRTDIPSRVDAAGIVRITDLVESIVRATPTLGRN